MAFSLKVIQGGFNTSDAEKAPMVSPSEQIPSVRQEFAEMWEPHIAAELGKLAGARASVEQAEHSTLPDGAMQEGDQNVRAA